LCTSRFYTCIPIIDNISPSFFTIKVDGPGGSSETFQGSATGTPVQLDTGGYTITENDFIPPSAFTLTTTFSGSADPAGCKQDPDVSTRATGTITAGINQTCEILNIFAVKLGSTGATSSITAQGTADSSDLTAMEKVTKLKTQWLNQLP
jgi:hypothetical protein